MLRCPIVINCRDRVSPLVALVEWLEGVGQDEIYLLDNDSTYPPLLEYYERSPHVVVRLGQNLGHRALWLTDRLAGPLASAEYYVYSDPDVVPVPECPVDALTYFSEVLGRFPEADKVGFGLRVDDLPDHYRFKNEVIRWEQQFWTRPLGPDLFWAPIDTTFALYRAGGGHELDKAIRTGHPYVARHTAWYFDSANIDEERAFYRARARKDTTHWSAEQLPEYLVEKIAALPTANVPQA